MYILIEIRTNNVRFTEKVSRNKKTLEAYLKTLGFYWSKDNGRYIDDKIAGGSGIDYIIEQVNEI